MRPLDKPSPVQYSVHIAREGSSREQSGNVFGAVQGGISFEYVVIAIVIVIAGMGVFKQWGQLPYALTLFDTERLDELQDPTARRNPQSGTGNLNAFPLPTRQVETPPDTMSLRESKEVGATSPESERQASRDDDGITPEEILEALANGNGGSFDDSGAHTVADTGYIMNDAVGGAGPPSATETRPFASADPALVEKAARNTGVDPRGLATADPVTLSFVEQELERLLKDVPRQQRATETLRRNLEIQDALIDFANECAQEAGQETGGFIGRLTWCGGAGELDWTTEGCACTLGRNGSAAVASIVTGPRDALGTSLQPDSDAMDIGVAWAVVPVDMIPIIGGTLGSVFRSGLRYLLGRSKSGRAAVRRTGPFDEAVDLATELAEVDQTLERSRLGEQATVRTAEWIEEASFRPADLPAAADLAAQDLRTTEEAARFLEGRFAAAELRADELLRQSEVAFESGARLDPAHYVEANESLVLRKAVREALDEARVLSRSARRNFMAVEQALVDDALAKARLGGQTAARNPEWIKEVPADLPAAADFAALGLRQTEEAARFLETRFAAAELRADELLRQSEVAFESGARLDPAHYVETKESLVHRKAVREALDEARVLSRRARRDFMAVEQALVDDALAKARLGEQAAIRTAEWIKEGSFRRANLPAAAEFAAQGLRDAEEAARFLVTRLATAKQRLAEIKGRNQALLRDRMLDTHETVDQAEAEESVQRLQRALSEALDAVTMARNAQAEVNRGLP